MLRGAASRVGPLPLKLRQGAHLKCYKWAGAKLKRMVGKRYYTGVGAGFWHPLMNSVRFVSDYGISAYLYLCNTKNYCNFYEMDNFTLRYSTHTVDCNLILHNIDVFIDF